MVFGVLANSIGLSGYMDVKISILGNTIAFRLRPGWGLSWQTLQPWIHQVGNFPISTYRSLYMDYWNWIALGTPNKRRSVGVPQNARNNHHIGKGALRHCSASMVG